MGCLLTALHIASQNSSVQACDATDHVEQFSDITCVPSRVSLVFDFTACARMDTYTASHYAARPPRPKLWSKSVWRWGVPFQIAIFLDKHAVRSETNDAPTKNIAAKATTCLRRGRVRIKCMSMNKCSIHCTSISQKIGLAQEVPYSSRTCSVYIRKYRQQVARCSPIQQSFWEVGCLQKTHYFFRSTQQKCSISICYEVCPFAFFSKIQDPLRRSSLNIESLCVQRSVSQKGYLNPF